MTDPKTAGEKRRYPRIALSKAARARAKEREAAATIRDISASGASIRTETRFAENDSVDLAIDGLNRGLSGRVVRAFDDGVAIEFELEAAEEEALLREINDLHDAARKADEY